MCNVNRFLIVDELVIRVTVHSVVEVFSRIFINAKDMSSDVISGISILINRHFARARVHSYYASK